MGKKNPAHTALHGRGRLWRGQPTSHVRWKRDWLAGCDGLYDASKLDHMMAVVVFGPLFSSAVVQLNCLGSRHAHVWDSK
jgi:hypothetical protein